MAIRTSKALFMILCLKEMKEGNGGRRLILDILAGFSFPLFHRLSDHSLDEF